MKNRFSKKKIYLYKWKCINSRDEEYVELDNKQNIIERYN
jgi:hypothetical protein